jgi:predicted RNA binding protein YcfA (HicA-like mRNA interferase family)
MKLHQRLEELKRSRRSVRPEVLHELLTAAGFTRRYGKGDHWIYSHPQRRYPLTIDPRNPLLPAYVSKAVRAMEEVLDEASEQED